MTYDYRKPRRLNIVSLFLVLGVAAGIYLGVKFLPVWWRVRQVDTKLDEYAVQVADFGRQAPEARDRAAEPILAKTVAELRAIGVDDQPDQALEVWFSPDYRELHARFEVIVEHNFGSLVKPTVMMMHRIRKVPQ